MLTSYRASAAFSKLPLKLLVLAQVPPPHHGQSAMVQSVVDGLPSVAPDIELHHVNLSLSRQTTDIGQWNPAKFFAAWQATTTAIRTARQHHCDALYYVPAPGKRIALWRDLLILNRIRPIVPRLILHWHASGLGQWLETSATPIEHRLAHHTLDHADLSITLAPSLAADAAKFRPRRSINIPNGIDDAFNVSPSTPAPDTTKINVLFIGLGNAAKGLFITLQAIAAGPASLHLTFAGTFESPADEARFHQLAAPLGHRVRHVGFVSGEAKIALFRTSHVLAFPTRYEHEAFPLVLLEALAADLPIVTTRWRAIPELLPLDYPYFVEPDSPAALANTLVKAGTKRETNGTLRQRFLANYTRDRFLQSCATAIREI